MFILFAGVQTNNNSTTTIPRDCHGGLRLNVSVKSVDCSSASLLNDSISVYQTISAGALCNNRGRCVANRYYDVSIDRTAFVFHDSQYYYYLMLGTFCESSSNEAAYRQHPSCLWCILTTHHSVSSIRYRLTDQQSSNIALPQYTSVCHGDSYNKQHNHIHCKFVLIWYPAEFGSSHLVAMVTQQLCSVRLASVVPVVVTGLGYIVTRHTTITTPVKQPTTTVVLHQTTQMVSRTPESHLV